MKNIKSLKNIKGKTIIIRVDFNVPIKDGKVLDNFRIKKAIPTIKYLKDKGAKIILITHLGKGGDTLLPVYKELKKLIKSDFINEIYSKKVKDKVANMKDGDILLLENLRNDKGEQSKDNNFALELSSLADFYVNEAFSVSHREDSSIVLLPKILPSFAGLQLEEEIKNLTTSFKNTKHPFIFILGGAKFSTKMPLIKKYLKITDYVFIGGALSNDFIKALGYNVGLSLIDKDNYGINKILKNKKLILPIDVLVKNREKLSYKKLGEIENKDFILDIGENTVINLEKYLKKAKFVLWNGPLGMYENGGDISSKKIIEIINKLKIKSIIAGGDTVGLLAKTKNINKSVFASTGGGATIDFLIKGTLPGIKILK